MPARESASGGPLPAVAGRPVKGGYQIDDLVPGETVPVIDVWRTSCPVRFEDERCGAGVWNEECAQMYDSGKVALELLMRSPRMFGAGVEAVVVHSRLVGRTRPGLRTPDGQITNGPQDSRSGMTMERVTRLRWHREL